MTDITRDFAWALTQVLGGVKEHDLTDQFGIPEDECAKVMSLLAQARAYLDQPEPEGPTDEELLAIAKPAESNCQEMLGGSLVERVAIVCAMPAKWTWDDQARAVIREVAAWLRGREARVRASVEIAGDLEREIKARWGRSPQ